MSINYDVDASRIPNETRRYIMRLKKKRFIFLFLFYFIFFSLLLLQSRSEFINLFLKDSTRLAFYSDPQKEKRKQRKRDNNETQQV